MGLVTIDNFQLRFGRKGDRGVCRAIGCNKRWDANTDVSGWTHDRSDRRPAYCPSCATHGRCQFCDATWDRSTDTSGWTIDPHTCRWIACPSCTAYRRAVARVQLKDRARYWDWFSCRCDAYDQELNQVRPHHPGCPQARGRS